MIKIQKSVRDAIVAHAKREAPIESCGYLAGTSEEISKFYPMTNIDNSPEHFSFDPSEQFKVVKAARAEGLSLVSVYHSHPMTPARLSQEDIRLFNDPNMIYIIVSLMNESEDVKGFRVIKPNENEVEIEAVNLEVV